MPDTSQIPPQEVSMKHIAILMPNCASDIVKHAVEELTAVLLDYTFAYPVCYEEDRAPDLTGFRRCYIGTRQSSSYICAHSSAALTTPEVIVSIAYQK